MYLDRYGMGTLCALFGKTRQAFYDYSDRQQCKGLRDTLVLKLVIAIRETLPCTGTDKLYYMLTTPFAEHGIKLGRDGLNELLDRHGMLIRRRRHKIRTTNSDHPYKKYPNLIRELILNGPCQLWVSDITYLRIKGGFCYLSIITDAYSHKLVGYQLHKGLHAAGPLQALAMAVGTNKIGDSLIHHSDRGVQYCCGEYVNQLEIHQIRISMTNNGDPYENPLAERVNGILKIDFDLEKTFDSYEAAELAVASAVERYNGIRPHGSCNYLTPNEAHEGQGYLRKRWRKSKWSRQVGAAEEMEGKVTWTKITKEEQDAVTALST